ncbi:hypothetical protein ACSLOB_29045, partial [Escherichia coli]
MLTLSAGNAIFKSTLSSFNDHDGHEWILECAPQSEVLFFYCYLFNNESSKIDKILEINSNR